MKRILYIALCILILRNNVSYAQVNGNPIVELNSRGDFFFEKSKAAADSAYALGDYLHSINLYESILNHGLESAEIYYNLGNSYYKHFNLSKAIINYERALLLSPNDDDIRFNLDLAKSKTIDKITPIAELFFVTWVKNIMQLFDTDTWAKVSIFLFLLFLSFLSAYMFSRNIKIRKIGFYSALGCLIFCIITNSFSYFQKEKMEVREYAIIVLPSVTAKSTPDDAGTDLFVLHEGHKIQVKDTSLRDWIEIRLEDGNIGWIPASALEII